MTVCELNEEQFFQLKQQYLDNHLVEVEDRTASYSELMNANEIVSDDIIYENYRDYDFSEEGFI